MSIFCLTADCPHQGRGLSATLCLGCPETYVFWTGAISCTADCPPMGCGLSAGLTWKVVQKLVFLWGSFEITGGLSGPVSRTVRRYIPLTGIEWSVPRV